MESPQEAEPRAPPFEENNDKKANINEISTPSCLKFDDDFVECEYDEKVQKMEEALQNSVTRVSQWREFAISRGGLVNDNIRKTIWPLLGGVTEDEIIDAPSLASLIDHKEYNQVKLDVDRSLKRFPPGIPYDKRVELQDQLTVLILRVIIKYPHLKYYQGYHDIAITLLLVCGEKSSFPLLCRLSHGETAPLEPFMSDTMEPTQHRLNYLHPIIQSRDNEIASFLKQSGVGTMFALPWYLTWFGHSLNRYSDVVRLYDYFLCAPPMFPIYVTAGIVLYRKPGMMELDCDMATLHCFLSRLPDDLPFEEILFASLVLYENYPPEVIEKKVIQWENEEKRQRKEDEERMKRRQVAKRNSERSYWLVKFHQIQRQINENPLLQIVPARYRAILATTTLLIGAYACYRFDYAPFTNIR